MSLMGDFEVFERTAAYTNGVCTDLDVEAAGVSYVDTDFVQCTSCGRQGEVPSGSEWFLALHP